MHTDYDDSLFGFVCVKCWYEREIALHLFSIVVRGPLLRLEFTHTVGAAFWQRNA